MQAGIEKYHADADLGGNGVVDDRDEALLQSMLNKPPGPGAGVLGRYYYYQNDHLNTPRIMTDRQQKVVWQGVSQAFGVTTVTVDEIENNLRFPGQYYDAGMGTHYNYFRDYDPRVGRYLQSDPIGLRGGLNTYSYVFGNPVRYIDPNGLNPAVCLIPGVNFACASAATAAGKAIIGGTALIGILSTPSDSTNDECESNNPDCNEHFTRCLGTSLADAIGGNFGSGRCGLCRDTCEQNGGEWQSIAHTGDRCDYWNFQ